MPSKNLKRNMDYYNFVTEFALLQIEKEEWRVLARRDKVLMKNKIRKEIYLWRVAPHILDEIITECKK